MGIDSCPLCDSSRSRALRNDVLRRCGNCGVIFNTQYRALDYDDSYFTADYRKQYGRTYEEDFENIYRLSLGRIKRISALSDRGDISGLSLLDAGSAMGFFLKAALDSGIKKVTGLEISGFASKYCREKFGIKVINSSFEDAEPGKFDIITGWYFLEHCREPLKTAQKIYNMLHDGGVFAFSLPSSFGPQYFFSNDEWLKSHPADHIVDFSPAAARRFLKLIGFSKIKIFPGGIHPERIISQDSLMFRPFSILYTLISRITSFSDTIEVYAKK